MKTVILRIPDDIHAALKQRKGSVNANVCELLAASLDIAYTPTKRGGQRIPKALTAEQIAKIEIIPTPLSPRAAPTISAVLEVKKKPFVRTVEQTPPTLQPNVKLKEQGYPYAQIHNGTFTGRLVKHQIYDSVDVGEMTLVEFQRRAGKKAYIE